MKFIKLELRHLTVKKLPNPNTSKIYEKRHGVRIQATINIESSTPFTQDEIKTVLLKSKKGKAPRYDKIPTDYHVTEKFNITEIL